MQQNIRTLKTKGNLIYNIKVKAPKEMNEVNLINFLKYL